uniref:Uncharacterized protein n=1 Tax=Candidatus Kentrum sp. DK TaxID=2126562 RepID=A0A450SU01_9GAMM|nr:MAG: hypothetical protein BECKDK2373C_GA0170839_104018 [Candidatus Kentron sp. DK]VFJ57451.1 MAG: hypothetical protein BECKDK2373B_GA0170837_106624 [Candidatus Kentron sp. DK]
MGWGEWSEPQHKPERIDIFDAPRSLSDLGVHREGKRDRDQNLCKFEANSGLFNEDLRKFWPISAFPQQNHPKSDRLLAQPRPQPNPVTVPGTGSRHPCRDDVAGFFQPCS